MLFGKERALRLSVSTHQQIAVNKELLWQIEKKDQSNLLAASTTLSHSLNLFHFQQHSQSNETQFAIHNSPTRATTFLAFPPSSPRPNPVYRKITKKENFQCRSTRFIDGSLAFQFLTRSLSGEGAFKVSFSSRLDRSEIHRRAVNMR